MRVEALPNHTLWKERYMFTPSRGDLSQKLPKHSTCSSSTPTSKSFDYDIYRPGVRCIAGTGWDFTLLQGLQGWSFPPGPGACRAKLYCHPKFELTSSFPQWAQPVLIGYKYYRLARQQAAEIHFTRGFQNVCRLSSLSRESVSPYANHAMLGSASLSRVVAAEVAVS
jgi:hypothetical protein